MLATFHQVEQNTEEWEQLRVGRVGGSSIAKIMANYGKAFGQPAKDLAIRIAIEQLTGIKNDSGYSNGHMERGHEQEPVARALYEDMYFCEVDGGGYFSLGEDEGVSPDGLVYDDGLIEIKSVIETVHFANIKRGCVDPSYAWQVYNELRITGREWNDFVSFCATFPEGKRLFVYRVYAKDCAEKFEMINSRMCEFRELVDQAKQTILAA